MQIHPNLVPYIQHITNVVIQASQNNRNNAARVYIANCVATNPQFVNEVVGTVCDFVTLNIGKGVIPGYSWGNLEQTINDAVVTADSKKIFGNMDGFNSPYTKKPMMMA